MERGRWWWGGEIPAVTLPAKKKKNDVQSGTPPPPPQPVTERLYSLLIIENGRLTRVLPVRLPLPGTQGHSIGQVH